jgi:hypothetical protein
MSERISANIRRDTAPSGIWNVTWRQWLTTFAPTLISFSRRPVSDHGFADFGIASVRIEVADLFGQRMELEPDGIGSKGPA